MDMQRIHDVCYEFMEYSDFEAVVPPLYSETGFHGRGHFNFVRVGITARNPTSFSRVITINDKTGCVTLTRSQFIQLSNDIANHLGIDRYFYDGDDDDDAECEENIEDEHSPPADLKLLCFEHKIYKIQSKITLDESQLKFIVSNNTNILERFDGLNVEQLRTEFLNFTMKIVTSKNTHLLNQTELKEFITTQISSEYLETSKRVFIFETIFSFWGLFYQFYNDLKYAVTNKWIP